MRKKKKRNILRKKQGKLVRMFFKEPSTLFFPLSIMSFPIDTDEFTTKLRLIQI